MSELTTSALIERIEQTSGSEGQDLGRSEYATLFAHPAAVLNAATLTGSEKRALLAAWASDACVVEGKPAWRWMPGTPNPVAVDEILASLQALDRQGLH